MALDAPLSRRPHVARLVRYGSVSAIATATSLTLLAALVGVVGLGAVWSNVLATAVGTVPSFELNRRWVWSRGGEGLQPRQVVPYVLLSFTGLVVSTVAVHLASDATVSATRLVRTAVVEIANFGAYGTLWIVQFVLCDRILFARRATDPSGADL
jgi:putative flippase GtrA